MSLWLAHWRFLDISGSVVVYLNVLDDSGYLFGCLLECFGMFLDISGFLSGCLPGGFGMSLGVTRDVP